MVEPFTELTGMLTNGRASFTYLSLVRLLAQFQAAGTEEEETRKTIEKPPKTRIHVLSDKMLLYDERFTQPSPTKVCSFGFEQ